MTALKDRFWAKVAFKEFIRHFRKLSPEQIVSDVMASMDALEDLDDEGDSFGSKMVRWSMERVEQYPMAQANGQKGGRPRKSITADGDIREDSQAKPDGSAITRNETRAHDALEPSVTISAVAPTREDGEFKSDSGNAGNLESATTATIYGESATSDGADVSTTFSKNMRRVPQNEAPAHGFSGGRTAQGTMSRSPEAAAQSGKDYDQGTDRRISTDEALELISARVMAPSPAPTRNVSALTPARNSRRPNSREEFHAFVADNSLHEGLAEEWYAMHEARGWVDENGNPIKNWRGALKNFCIKIEQKRRTA